MKEPLAWGYGDASLVLVTTKADYLAHYCVTREYDLRKFTRAVDGEGRAELLKDVVELVTQTVDPESWDMGGGKWCYARENGGILTVRQTDENHRLIVNLLDHLEETRGTLQRWVTNFHGA